MFLVIRFIFSIVAIMCLTQGLICIIKPSHGIETQRRLAQKMNWKMEPINMKLELRNTRAMGVVLIGGSIILFILLGVIKM